MRNLPGLLFICITMMRCANPGSHPAGYEALYYTEKHRPQIHFSPEQKWMNDPNGMVFFDGEYHLFYQHYPDSNVWGPMHWGHASSKDLITWNHLPIALYPDSLGYIFSGSVVVDNGNTSGLGSGDQPPLVAIFTYHNSEREKMNSKDYQTQGIAYSTDKGKSWKKFAGNPVLSNPGHNDFRDPKVFWHEESKKWIMSLAVYDRIHFYNSPDLIHWEKTGEFGADFGSRTFPWECPDLFSLPVGQTKKWILLVSVGTGGPFGGSATQYFIGNFDGETFVCDDTPQTIHWMDYGRDNYAGVTWSNIPASDGRRIFLGWMSNWEYARDVPTTVWRSAMTIPRELRLINSEPGLRIQTSPVAELTRLHKKGIDLSGQKIEGVKEINLEESALTPLEIEMEIEAEPGTIFYVQLTNEQQNIYKMGVDLKRNSFFSDRLKSRNSEFSDVFAQEVHYGPRLNKTNKVKLHLYLDRSSAELFGDDGDVMITDLYFPDEDFNSLQFVANGGKCNLISCKIYPLKSIWAK